MIIFLTNFQIVNLQLTDWTKGAMKRGRGTCSTFQSFLAILEIQTLETNLVVCMLTLHARTNVPLSSVRPPTSYPPHPEQRLPLKDLEKQLILLIETRPWFLSNLGCYNLKLQFSLKTDQRQNSANTMRIWIIFKGVHILDKIV